MYVYIRSEPGLYTVGFYGPHSQWHPESDHPTTEQAAARVHFLNGGQRPSAGSRQLPPPRAHAGDFRRRYPTLQHIAAGHRRMYDLPHSGE